jgi:ABC-type glycerol-3-phosphate transport system substrate-binding protein
VNERAASRSWFVPAAKHWVDVENGNILRNMLAQILKGKLTVKQAAASASDNITSVLNGS